jgi:hypothetical protein
MRYELANNPNADPHNRGRPDTSGGKFSLSLSLSQSVRIITIASH